jgi:hypothetical protein
MIWWLLAKANLFHVSKHLSHWLFTSVATYDWSCLRIEIQWILYADTGFIALWIAIIFMHCLPFYVKRASTKPVEHLLLLLVHRCGCLQLKMHPIHQGQLVKIFCKQSRLSSCMQQFPSHLMLLLLVLLLLPQWVQSQQLELSCPRFLGVSLHW